MQNAPAMLAQKMMNRQAPYRPVGMVSQNMSGNKKVSSPYMSISASVLPIADGKYDVYIFNSSGTFTVNAVGPDPTEGAKFLALVLAGGGGNSGYSSVAGGAGGYQEKNVNVTAQTYPITVGAGGSSSGANSSIGSVLVSTGGGTGTPFADPAKNGASGGGGYQDIATNSGPGTGIAGQGFSGGTTTFSGGATSYACAGGGGAGGVGGNGSITVGGNGGAGVTSSISGTAIARGGGGAGVSFNGTNYYLGTSTAGGASNGVNAVANKGGGGGYGFGGSGVVIIRVRARA